jgi:hypothetical protein
VEDALLLRDADAVAGLFGDGSVLVAGQGSQRAIVRET